MDLCFTDPPYNMEFVSRRRVKSPKFPQIMNDDTNLNFMGIIKEHVRGFVFVCTSWKVLEYWLHDFKQYFALTNLIIWDKSRGGPGDLKKTFATDYELILTSNQGQPIKNKRIASIWRVPKDRESTYHHPTQKPVNLARIAIEHTTDPGASVLDLFGGSGSTLIACEQTARRCFMMELDPQYMAVIIERWEELTGLKAELIRSAE